MVQGSFILLVLSVVTVLLQLKPIRCRRMSQSGDLSAGTGELRIAIVTM